MSRVIKENSISFALFHFVCVCECVSLGGWKLKRLSEGGLVVGWAGEHWPVEGLLCRNVRGNAFLMWGL